MEPKEGLLIGGESAGADLAMIVAHLYTNENLEPPLTGLYAPLFSAVNSETVPDMYKDRFFSMKQNSQAPLLTQESIKFIHSKEP